MTDSGYPPPPPPPGGGSTPPGGGYGAPPPPMPGGGVVGDTTGGLAAWPQRAGGYIIDQLIYLPGYILYFIGAPKTFNASSNVNGDISSTSGTSGGNTLILLLGVLVLIGIGVWNRWIKGGQGQTIGKKVVGLKLIDEATGQPIGTLKAFLRDLAHILDSIVCGLPIGWLWPLWDQKRQTWSDKIMKTVVVTVAK